MITGLATSILQFLFYTGVRLAAEKKLAEPRTVDVVEMVPNKGPLGKAFKKEGKAVIEAVSKLDAEAVSKHEAELESSGKFTLTLPSGSFDITKEMVAVKRYQKTVHVEELIPSVIEPSMGVGRVMYAVFEHCFKVRQRFCRIIISLQDTSKMYQAIENSWIYLQEHYVHYV